MSEKVVKLSAETLQILKIASAINKSLAFKTGNEIKTVTATGHIIMEAEILESFPNDFAIYELNKLLGVLALPSFKDAELVFVDGVDTHMIIRSGTAKTKYYYTPEEFAQHPGKKIVLPKVDVEFSIQQHVLENFEKAAAALGHKMLRIKVEDKKLYLTATTPSVDTSNDYIVEMGDIEADNFDELIKLEYLKLVSGDFNVQLVKAGSKGLSKWTHLTRKITTYIALEMN